MEIFAPALACLEIYSRKAAADTPDLGTVCDARARQARRSSTITAKEGTACATPAPTATAIAAARDNTHAPPHGAHTKATGLKTTTP